MQNVNLSVFRTDYITRLLSNNLATSKEVLIYLAFPKVQVNYKDNGWQCERAVLVAANKNASSTSLFSLKLKVILTHLIANHQMEFLNSLQWVRLAVNK